MTEGPDFEARDLNGKVVLVTGGTRGIGHHLCKRLVAEYPRMQLIITGRHEAAVQEAVAQLRIASGGSERTVEGVRCDQGNLADIKRLAAFVERRFGRLDVLINNSAVMPGFAMGMDAVSDELDTECLRVNAEGCYFTTKYLAKLLFVPCCDEADFEKTVVFVSSSAAYLEEPEPGNGMLSYHMSKAAVNGLMVALHQTYVAQDSEIGRTIQDNGAKRLGRVVAVNPGFVETGLGRETWQDRGAPDTDIARAKASFGAISLDSGIDTLFYVTAAANGVVQSGKLYDRRRIHSF